MSLVFADTAYWIAIANPADQWNASARLAMARLNGPSLVTTEEVLSEFLTAFSGGTHSRNRAVRAVRLIQADDKARVVHQSHESFTDGLARYERRLDKGYSLQDCVSMNVMESEGISQVLTSDRHFEQEGFTILMKPGQ